MENYENYIVELEPDGSFPSPSNKIYKLKHKQKLRITLSTRKFFAFNPFLLTNIPKAPRKRKGSSPLNGNAKLRIPNSQPMTSCGKYTREFIEKNYTILEGKFDEEGDWNCEIDLQTTGPLFLQVVFVPETDSTKSHLNIQELGKPEWINVEPDLKINGRTLNYSQISMQTLLTTSIGKIDRWKKVLETQRKLGYNGFHFTPVQPLGLSESLYALKDQLEFNPNIFPHKQAQENMKLLKDVTDFAEQKLGAICFVDILLNHTSFDSPWLEEETHNNSYYNNENTPHLNSALVLDCAIQELSTQICEKTHPKYKKDAVEDYDDLNFVMEIIKYDILPSLQLEEYFQFNVDEIVNNFRVSYKEKFPEDRILENEAEILSESQGNFFGVDKFDMILKELEKDTTNLGHMIKGVKIDFEKFSLFWKSKSCILTIKKLYEVLDYLNWQRTEMARGYLQEALDGIRGTLEYHKIKCKENPITYENQLVSPYFSKLKNGRYAANNGWIMSIDCQEDFAKSMNFRYLRRHIVIWGDLVKLRYGTDKSQSPALWKRMKNYVQTMASCFNGFRLDNSHNTPLHVGEYFLRKARKVNQNLHVFAELFTGSPELDALYTKKIGYNALVKEAQRFSDNGGISWLLGTFGFMYKMLVGSLERFYEIDPTSKKKWFYLTPTDPVGLVYDLTHDNPSYCKIRPISDSLSKAALLSFSNVFVGTTKGFDEFFEENVSVIKEKRLYLEDIECDVKSEDDNLVYCRIIFTPKNHAGEVLIKGSWDEWRQSVRLEPQFGKGFYQAILPLKAGSYEYKFIVDGVWLVDSYKEINKNNNHDLIVPLEKIYTYSNISYIRSKFNEIQLMFDCEYPEIYMETKAYDTIFLMREHRKKTTHKILICRNAFTWGQSSDVDIVYQLPGVITNVEFICWSSEEILEKPKDSDFLRGMKGKVFENKQLRRYCDIFYNPELKCHLLHFTYMPPSFCCVISTKIVEEKRKAIDDMNEFIKNHSHQPLHKIIDSVSPYDINYALFVSEPEEGEMNHQGTFYVENMGKLVYAGLAGLYKELRDCSLLNNLQSPLFDCLRNGSWLNDYMLKRLAKRESLKELHSFISEAFKLIRSLPKHDMPNYFCQVIFMVMRAFGEKITFNLKMPSKLSQIFSSSKFLKQLLVSSYQFISNVPSGTMAGFNCSLAAGLPHFSTGWSRCWGRDTFISFKGCLLVTGLFKEAREIIIQFARSLRHGLLPNLLDKGNNPRYNCRDSCWWFIKAVGDYMEFTRGEDNIFSEKVELLFLDDIQEKHYQKKAQGENKVIVLAEVIQNIFESHARGIKFIEWNAGDAIDTHMYDEGFNIELKMDEQTGFIFGGNGRNCLTWMDKMGSSFKAGNKGVPSTPRDGAPIEMTGLLKHALEIVIKFNSTKQNLYPFDGVTLKNGKKLSFKHWADTIKHNFEKCYYIPIESEKDESYSIKSSLIKKRGIYKDVYKGLNERNDYLLRPNACIAIAVAPELFIKKNAFIYIGWVEKNLMEEESIGLKTLDKEDPDYISYYDNSNDSFDRRIAHGASYHNGPEWVWSYGYFLKAFCSLNAENKQIKMERYTSFLASHKKYIQRNPWLSLPEITNRNGELCPFSCPAQTWSIATLLEAYYDIIHQ